MPALALVLACLLWGISFPLIKALHLEQAARLPEADSVFLSVWLQAARAIVAALLLAPWCFRMRATRSEWRQGAELAFWSGLGLTLQADGLAYTHASTSAFLTQAYAVILPLWACVATRRLPAARILVATVAVVLGGAILAGVTPGNFRLGRGEWETLAAAVVFAVQIRTLERPRFAGNRGVPVTAVMFVALAAMMLPAAFVCAPSPGAVWIAGASLPAAGMVFALAALCSVGGYLLMNTWQPKLSSSEAGLIYTAEPVFTAVFAMFLPGLLAAWAGIAYANEAPTRALLLGGGLILGANLLVVMAPRKKRAA